MVPAEARSRAPAPPAEGACLGGGRVPAGPRPRAVTCARPAPPLPSPSLRRRPRALPQPGAMAEQPAEPAPAPAPAPAVAPLPAATPAPPAALPLPTPPGGSQRLLFSHDLVSGRYRGSVRFGLVRLIHGEDSDSEEEEGGGGGGGRGTGGGGGAASSGGSESGGPGAGGAEEGRASPLRRGYVRVQWYPEGIKQHVKETKVSGAAWLGLRVRLRVSPHLSGDLAPAARTGLAVEASRGRGLRGLSR